MYFDHLCLDLPCRDNIFFELNEMYDDLQPGNQEAPRPTSAPSRRRPRRNHQKVHDTNNNNNNSNNNNNNKKSTPASRTTTTATTTVMENQDKSTTAQTTGAVVIHLPPKDRIISAHRDPNDPTAWVIKYRDGKGAKKKRIYKPPPANMTTLQKLGLQSCRRGQQKSRLQQGPVPLAGMNNENNNNNQSLSVPHKRTEGTTDESKKQRGRRRHDNRRRQKEEAKLWKREQAQKKPWHNVQDNGRDPEKLFRCVIRTVQEDNNMAQWVTLQERFDSNIECAEGSLFPEESLVGDDGGNVDCTTGDDQDGLDVVYGDGIYNVDQTLPAADDDNSVVAPEEAHAPCALCAQRPRSHIALPCLHYAFCSECAKRLEQNKLKCCPICNTPNVVYTKVQF